MNKLVSRNPVQRFKQGKKIQKFQEAGKIYYKGRDGKDYEAWRGGNDWYYRQRGTTGMTRMPYDYTTTTGQKFYSSTPRGAVANNYETVKKMYNKYGSAEQQLAKQQAKTEGVIPLGGIASTRERILNRNQKNKNVRDTTSNSTKVTPKKSSYDKFIYANEGKLGGWNKSVGLGNINDQESLDIIKQLGWEGKSAEEVQNLLNSNDIGGNRVVVDNKWGNQSKAALQNYYSRWKDEQEMLHPTVKKENSSTIQLPQAPIMQRQAISDYSNYASNLKSALGNNNNFQGLSNLVWKEYADDDNSFAANFSRDMRTRFKDYGTQQSWLDNQAAIEKMLNISGRYRGSRSGDFGDIARSQASWAGEYNQGIDKQNQAAFNNYNAIIDKYKRTVGGYKIGGTLPSRNIVERFKNRINKN